MSVLQINLVPDAIRRRRTAQRATRLWCAVLPPTLVASVIGAVVLLGAGPESASGEEANILPREPTMQELFAAEQQLLAEVALLEKRLEAEAAGRDRVDWLLLLGVLDRVRGDQVTLTSVDIRRRTDLIGVDVQISGTATTTSSATLFVERLRETDLFADVALPRTAIGGGRATFVIVARMESMTASGEGGSE